jgi:hypothetical protein
MDLQAITAMPVNGSTKEAEQVTFITRTAKHEVDGE